MDAEASFLQFRDRVRQRIPLSYESPASNDKTPASNWTERIKVTLGILRERSTDVCIFKVPNELRKVNGDAYSPQIVAIGPLHEGEHDLLTMEEHKWRYMLFFLQRTTNEHNTLDDCSKAILDLVERARESYAQDIKFNKYELAEIMLVDGCFILELFLRCSDPHTEPEDSIIHNDRMVSNLQHDLALLENQIPFCILEKLFYIVYPNRPCPASITELALSFFLPAFKLNKEEIKNKCSFLCDSHSHLLDLLHKFYLPPYPKKDQQGKKSFHAPQQDELRLPLTSDPICEDDATVECWSSAQLHPGGEKSRQLTKCATELLEAGIEFKKREEAHLLEIGFDEDEGDIKIPPLHIDENTRSLLRNLIAFEQCSLGKTGQHITSYAILLGRLIKSSPDLELLQKEGLVTYDWKEVEDVLTFFKNISRGVVPKAFYFGELCQKVNAYQKSWWHWHRLEAHLKFQYHLYMVALKRDYFSTPWSSIAFLAASLLLALTIAQTYYAARS